MICQSMPATEMLLPEAVDTLCAAARQIVARRFTKHGNHVGFQSTRGSGQWIDQVQVELMHSKTHGWTGVPHTRRVSVMHSL